MSFENELRAKKKAFEDLLYTLFTNSDSFKKTILEGMAYSVKAGGKRLRPILLMEACKACGGDVLLATNHAMAIELIHTYSLIHDDLPAMDDDDLRRGSPTNHKVFGEGRAVLSGDGLLNMAYELMILACLRSERPQRALRASLHIATAAGVDGMIGGQVIDLTSEGKAVDKTTLNYIHANKTAALIEASVVAGAEIAGAATPIIQTFKQYGYHLGLAFQIIDDILDLEGSVEKMGKAVGGDCQHDKNTFPKVYGLATSKSLAEHHTKKALAQLDTLALQNDFFNHLTHFLLKRAY